MFHHWYGCAWIYLERDKFDCNKFESVGQRVSELWRLAVMESLFATRKYPRSLVYLPSSTSSDIVASPFLATSPDCKTTPQHISPTISRQPLTRSSSPSLLESSAWSPTWQMDRPNSKRHQPDDCRPLETGPWTRSSWTSDGSRWLCDDDDDE